MMLFTQIFKFNIIYICTYFFKASLQNQHDHDLYDLLQGVTM